MRPGALTQLIRRVSTNGPNRWQATANGCMWIARLEDGALVVVGKHSGLELPSTVPLHGTVDTLIGENFRHPAQAEADHV